MFSKHVTSFSSAYIHDELTPRENQRVAEHLLSCATCRADFDDVKLGAKFAKGLQILPAPDSVWAGLVARLDRQDARPARRWFLKPLAIAAALIVSVGASLVLLRSNRSHEFAQWNVSRLGGSPRIDSENFGDRGKLGRGQWLETDATSRARIDVATIGNVEIDPNSRVRLLQTSSSEHRLELARGRLSARISAPPKLFFVNTPSGVAEDLGCAYTLEVDNDGNSILHVTLGWVSLQLTDRESSVPAGAACAMKRGVGPGTPYFEDASEAFRTSLAKVNFDGPQATAAALPLLLTEARPRDAMTLWYLLLRVDESQRGLVYDRLSALIAPPEEVTREGTINLNQQMLNRWKAKLGIRSETIRPRHSFWAKLWAETFGRIHGLEGKR
ncbi:MAG: FecR domain-containing protein [Pyrinomonadaceae bacterium]